MYSSRKYQSNPQEEHCKSQAREGIFETNVFKNVGTLGICWSSISQYVNWVSVYTHTCTDMSAKNQLSVVRHVIQVFRTPLSTISQQLVGMSFGNSADTLTVTLQSTVNRISVSQFLIKMLLVKLHATQ